MSLVNKIERIRIAFGKPLELEASYLRAGSSLRTAAVICISMVQEPGATLLGRRLPATFGRELALLIITHKDLLGRSRREVNILLSSCLDYLSARPDIEASRIGVYGEGLSAVLATDFATSDRRLAAAVCDGGLWNWSRHTAAVGWIARDANDIDKHVSSANRSQWARQLKCPVLVIVGGRGVVSAPRQSR